MAIKKFKPTTPGQRQKSVADFSGLTTSVQVRNGTDYQGYLLTTTIGFGVSRIQLKDAPSELRVRGFVTMYAGIQL